MRHVATIAAGALSCELATIRVEHDGQTLTEVLTLGDQPVGASPSEATSVLDLATRADAPIVAQASDAGWELFGTEVASHMALQIGKTPALGALLLGHSVARPRGFTSLCQRIARALADAAELLLSQAAAREQLASERDLLARMTRTDPLTGAPNRRAWDDAVERFASARTGNVGHVLSCDLDGLKAANDRYGHPAGDALIRGTANLLLSCVRDTDLVARLGGDEFLVLLYDADAKAAEVVTRRIRRAERLWRITEHGLTPRFSLGLANIIDGDVEDARQRADARMYANKRLRARRAASDPTTRRPNRRRSR
jgi:diguanylate cyclase (GGDEF)-like protein